MVALSFPERFVGGAAGSAAAAGGWQFVVDADWATIDHVAVSDATRIASSSYYAPFGYRYWG